MFFFFFNDTATTEIYTLSLHDALPIYAGRPPRPVPGPPVDDLPGPRRGAGLLGAAPRRRPVGRRPLGGGVPGARRGAGPGTRRHGRGAAGAAQRVRPRGGGGGRRRRAAQRAGALGD